MAPLHGAASGSNDAAGVGNYVFLRTLGQGNFATVKLARHSRTSQEVAIKIIDKTVLQPKQLQKLYREVRILKKLDHPHIIKLYEVLESDDALFLVLEYVSGGELYDFLIAQGKMKEKEARSKFLQIMSALLYCHSRRIIHRDLKAENLLLDADLNIKVADFGFSNTYDPAGMMETFCGSPPYAAPELFQGVRYTGPEVDIWSLGIILYVMTTSCLPFDGRNFQEMKAVVCRGRFIIPDHVSESLKSLIRSMVIVDRTQRASLSVFLDHPWLNEDGSAIERLLKLGVDREAIFDQGSLLSRDQDLLKFDAELVQAMSIKFAIPREEIESNIRNNHFNEITTTYKLMLKDRHLYVASAADASKSGTIAGGSSSSSNSSKGSNSDTSSERPLSSDASTLPATDRSSQTPTPSVSEQSNDDDDDSQQHEQLHHPHDVSDTIRAITSPVMGRRRPLTIAIPEAATENDARTGSHAARPAGTAAGTTTAALSEPNRSPNLTRRVMQEPTADVPEDTPSGFIHAPALLMSPGAHIATFSPRVGAAAPPTTEAVRIGNGRSASVRKPRRRSVTLTAAMPEATSRFGIITKLTAGGHELVMPATPTSVAAPPHASTLAATISASTARLPSPRNPLFKAWSPRRPDDRSSLSSTATAPDDASARTTTPTTPFPTDLADFAATSLGGPQPHSADSPRSEPDDSSAAAAEDSIGPLPSVSSSGITSPRPRRRSGLTATIQKHILQRRVQPEPHTTATGASPPLTSVAAARTDATSAAPATVSNPNSPNISPSVGPHGGAGADVSKPRTVNFAFSALTTSSNPPADMMKQILVAAKQIDLAIEQTGAFCARLGSSASAVEVEVCRIRRFTKTHGLRFKRLAGSSEEYKVLCEQLLSVVRL